MHVQAIPDLPSNPARERVRLYYLDWLRVIAVLGVFLIHVTAVFNEVDFHIKNLEQSEPLTTFGAFFYPWGMPLMFLIAGGSSYFALQRRDAQQFARERFYRLLIPFVVGSILFSPVIVYFEWRNKIAVGRFEGSLTEWVRSLAWEANPRIIGEIGDHLWFLCFLFCFSLLALPLFRWLDDEAGQHWVAWMARLCETRGGTLLFVLPLLAVRLGLQPFFPQYLNWTDFFSFLIFYILGYVVFSDPRFLQSIRRDWLVSLVLGVASFGLAVLISIVTDKFDIELLPVTALDFAWWALFTLCSWCWVSFMLAVGMHFMNQDNRQLRYSQAAALPFYVFHMPVVVIIAYYVVQWDMSLLPKLLVVGAGSFAVILALYFLIRRIGWLRVLVGMKPGQHLQDAGTGSSSPSSSPA